MSEPYSMVAAQQPSHIYGAILSRSIHLPPKPPALGTCISQGAATGAAISFLTAVAWAFMMRDLYLYVTLILPVLVVYGMAFGVFEGFVIWVCARITNRNLFWISRAIIGGMVVVIPVYFSYLVSAGPAGDELMETPFFFTVTLVCLAMGIGFGAVIGSRLNPWRAMVRGVGWLPAHWLLTGFTGLVLRALVIFLFMESAVIMTYLIPRPQPTEDLPFVLIAFAHFTAALAVVFIRMKFWLLWPLVFVINSPVILFLLELRQEKPGFMFYLTLGYLAVWAAFLLTRWSRMYSALAFIKGEIHYYLID